MPRKFILNPFQFIPIPNRVFGLRNELVHHLLNPHYFCLVCGME
jgi:hypothetical protein